MAFFKLRWPGQLEQPEKSKKQSRTTQTESIDVMRRRARHRLIGAAVLVLIGVLIFPVLFDTQPRPILVDIPIEIPDRNAVSPLASPNHAVADTNTSAAVRQTSAAASVSAGSARNHGLSDGEEVVETAHSNARTPVRRAAPEPPAPAAPVKPVSRAAVATPTATEPKVPRTSVSSSSSDTSAATDERFIVQVGAFAENDKAHEVRVKLEKAGLKTYAQAIDTKDGKRIRVRVGPFNNRADAEKAAIRIKNQNLPAAILTL